MARRYVLFLGVTLAVVLLDHWTKYLAVDHLTSFFDAREGVAAELGALYGDPPPQSGVFHYPPKGKVEVFDGLLRFRYAENPGAAWGLFRTLPPNVRGPLFHVVSIGAVILIVSFFRKLTGKPEERWALWGLPLVLGGALGTTSTASPGRSSSTSSKRTGSTRRTGLPSTSPTRRSASGWAA